MSRFISELIDWVTRRQRKTLHCDLGRYVILKCGNGGNFFYPPLSGVPHLFGSILLLAHRLEPSGQQGPQCAGEGEHLSCGDVWGSGGGAYCSPGAFVSDTVPLWGLMRTNWSVCNQWIIEEDKRLYFGGAACRGPPIICPLSRAGDSHLYEVDSLNISLSLSRLFLLHVHGDTGCSFPTVCR